MGVKPPGVKDKWDDCDVCTQSLLIAYNQVREHDESIALGAKP